MSRRQNPFLGVGIYTVPEAAHLTGVPSRRIRRWLDGYAFKYGGKTGESPPVWRRELPDIENAAALGFLDLMEVRFVDAFRRRGVSWRTIRLAAEKARALFGSDHPFSTQSFKTDGCSIFAEVRDETGDEALLDVVRSQLAFKKILEGYLYGLEYVDECLVRWWPLGTRRSVVLDPKRGFGQPIVAKRGVPTAILARAVNAEQSIEEVADWYEVDTRSVRDSVEFEEKIAA